MSADRREQVDHRCRNRVCVNPDHLEMVSASENIKRARDHAKRSRGLEPWQCRRGHDKRGRKRCLECHAGRERARREAKRMGVQ